MKSLDRILRKLRHTLMPGARHLRFSRRQRGRCKGLESHSPHLRPEPHSYTCRHMEWRAVLQRFGLSGVFVRAGRRENWSRRRATALSTQRPGCRRILDCGTVDPGTRIQAHAVARCFQLVRGRLTVRLPIRSRSASPLNSANSSRCVWTRRWFPATIAPIASLRSSSASRSA